METSDELKAFLEKATQQGVWGRLQDRGAAWSIMRREGVLPDDAPPLGDTIEVDLAEHGFTLLRAALWQRLDLCSLLDRYGTAGGGGRFLGTPEQAYLPGLT